MRWQRAAAAHLAALVRFEERLVQWANTVYLKLADQPVVGPVLHRARRPIARALFYLRPNTRRAWEKRIRAVMASPDNDHIPRVPDAGRVVDGYLIMHNGIRIVPGSYYGEGMRLLLSRNRGVHEPQQERIFAQVLEQMPPAAVMVELGAYWAFYSMWFHQCVSSPTCLLVEPVKSNLAFGRDNFAANGMTGTFVHALVGARPGRAADGTPVVSLDAVTSQHHLEHIDILHADIQGAEADMLRGATRALDDVDYIFLSTHSPELHRECRGVLLARGFTVIGEATMDESYSEDGLLVARRVAPG